jgi:hypothetical protein
MAARLRPEENQQLIQASSDLSTTSASADEAREKAERTLSFQIWLQQI